MCRFTNNDVTMETNRVSKTAMQALGWLGKMNIEVKPAIKSGVMYQFMYNGILMFISVDTNDNELFLSTPIYLLGETDERNKDIYDIAEYMTHEELKDYIVEYVTDSLAYVGKVYVLSDRVRQLRRYQLIHMLEEIVEVHNTFLLATMIASAPIEEKINNTPKM